MKHRLSIRCPECDGNLEPKVLECTTCGIRVEGTFSRSEFDRLDADEIHFLRIFLHCDGKIREIEKALGISYPTVKNRLMALKLSLGLGGDAAPEGKIKTTREKAMITRIIETLEKGNISPSEALEQINALNND